MKNEEPLSRRPQGCDYSDTVGQQEAMHREAIRRLDHIAGAAVDTATGRTMDSWSSSGTLPGVITPDLQPEANPANLTFPITPVSSGFEEGNANFEQIMRNPHGERR